MRATKIAERYVGKENADEYGRRNSGEGSVLVRITPERIIGEKDTAIRPSLGSPAAPLRL
jgi:hypothetical protein